MPELPEVDTVRHVLTPYLVGRRITKVTVNLPKVVANQTVAAFVNHLTGQTITAVTRRGKYLTLHLQSGDYVVLHLRMTGCLTVQPATDPFIKHTNLVLTLDNSQTARFEDSRGFGKWWFFPAGTPDTSGAQNLGPEPDAVTPEYLTEKLGKRHTALKKLLLDQTIVAGIGNIYADEICFNAGILPTRLADTLTAAEIQRLSAVIPERINHFIQKHRVTFAEYTQAQGKSYQTDRYLQVYSRAGQPCVRCHTPLVRTVIGGRSSVYCPQCQK